MSSSLCCTIPFNTGSSSISRLHLISPQCRMLPKYPVQDMKHFVSNSAISVYPFQSYDNLSNFHIYKGVMFLVCFCSGFRGEACMTLQCPLFHHIHPLNTAKKLCYCYQGVSSFTLTFVLIGITKLSLHLISQSSLMMILIITSSLCF